MSDDTQPDQDTITRMSHAAAHAMSVLRVRAELRSDAGSERWGWRGRTLGLPVRSGRDDAWLRVASSLTTELHETFWTGNPAAEAHLPGAIARPRLRARYGWRTGSRSFVAELFDRSTSQPCSRTAVMEDTSRLDPTWMHRLRDTLDRLAAVTTERYTIQQGFLNWMMPQHLGEPIDVDPGTPWVTSHGDLHWANLAGPDLVIFDWEGWGMAPAGYDAAMLACHSMLTPAVEAQVRATFSDTLDTAGGRHGELVVIAELLSTRPHLADRHVALLRDRAEVLLGRPVPAPPHTDVRSVHA